MPSKPPPSDPPRKVIRSYRLVFRRRWRIFKLQGWRIPLPNGLELRAVGYWLCCLIAMVVLGRLPLLGAALTLIPPAVRLLALPLVGAWALSNWEVDGRSPHRALVGLAGYALRPRTLAGLRRCPPAGTTIPPPDQLTLGPDLTGSAYPRGRLTGPARLLLRYPVEVEPLASTRRPRRPGHRYAPVHEPSSAPEWRLRPVPGATPLYVGKVLEVPAGRRVSFE